MTAEDGERGGSSDVWWKTVPQMSGCNRKHYTLSPTVDRWVCRICRDVDEAKRSCHLASVSAGLHSLSYT